MPSVVDVRDYRDLYTRTRNISPEIRKELRRRLREAANIGARAAKAKVLEMPTYAGTGLRSARYRSSRRHLRGTHRTGLRLRLAANIRVSVTARNVEILQGSTGITGRSGRSLPRRIDEGGTFRHPVYGHRDRWASQIGYRYFQRTIDGKKQEMLVEVSHVLDEISRQLT